MKLVVAALVIVISGGLGIYLDYKNIASLPVVYWYLGTLSGIVATAIALW